MPRHIMKEAPDLDYYVEWSSIVDAPVWSGNRKDMLAHLEEEMTPAAREEPHADPETRLQRADTTGTSALWGMPGRPEGGWSDDTWIYEQRGILTRAGVFELCRRLDQGNVDVSDLLQPFED